MKMEIGTSKMIKMGGLIILLLIGLIIIPVESVLAVDAIYAPSIFASNPLESQFRTVVENLLFLQVIEDELQGTDLSVKEIRLLEDKRNISQGIIAQIYEQLRRDYPANLSKDSFRELILKMEATGETNNETQLLSFLVHSLQSQEQVLNLQAQPRLDRREPSYRFYHGFLAELTRLARLFPDIPSEILPFDDREVLGFRFSKRQVVLTFDDGPSAVTETFLITLERTNTPGAFFIQGTKLFKDGELNQMYLDYMGRAIALGADLGVHTVTHPNLIKITDEDRLGYEVGRVKEILQAQLGYDTQFFRAPFGSRNEATLDYIYQEYLFHILWNIDSQDWRKEFTQEIMLERIIRLVHLYNGGIVLFHDTNRKSATILPELITRLQGCGFEFRSLSDLLVQ